jgi:sec-independent protein translocase protein TatC
MIDTHDKAALDDTKMSFGAHLEQLRSALFKAMLAIAVGFLIGLTLGWSVIRFIQTPLKDALEAYYRGHAQQTQLERLQEMRAAGLPVPEDLEAAAKFTAEEGLVPLTYYVAVDDLRRALGESGENQSSAKPSSEADPDSPSPENASPENASSENGQIPAPGDVPGPVSPGDRVQLEPVHKSDMVKLRLYQSLEDDIRVRIVGLSVQEGFMVYVKASLVAGVLFASPFVFFYLWDFVAAGLYHHEKNKVYIYLPLSLGLFLAGAALAFFVVFDYVLEFLFWFYSQMGIDPDPRISEWISFVLMLPLGFGVSFQLPLVMLFLQRVGVFTIKDYLQKWRPAVLVIAVLSMFLTPADPGSMIMMAVPLIALYFGGIGLCHFMPKGQPPDIEADLSGETTG